MTFTVTMGVTTDVTTWTVQFTVKQYATDPTALITKTIANGGVAITSAGNGVWTVTIAAADTLNLPGDSFVFDFSRLTTAKVTVSYGNLSLVDVATFPPTI